MNQPDLFQVERVPASERPTAPSGAKKIRGTAADPGTGPAGETCKTCLHYALTAPGANLYRKCLLMRAHWTHGPGTDIKAGYPACKHWEAKAQAEKPYGHAGIAVCHRRIGSRLPKGAKIVNENSVSWLVEVPVHCKGPLTRLERSCRLMHGFQRLESIEAYTEEQWVRVYGRGSEKTRF